MREPGRRFLLIIHRRAHAIGLPRLGHGSCHTDSGVIKYHMGPRGYLSIWHVWLYWGYSRSRLYLRLYLRMLNKPRKPAPSDPSTKFRTLQNSPLCSPLSYIPFLAPTCTFILPDTQEGAVPHRDRPAHVPWSVGEHKGECIMLVCKCEPCDHASPKSRK